MRTLIILLLTGTFAIAEENVDLAAIYRIKTEAFQHSKVMDHAFYLTDVYWPSLTGPPGLDSTAAAKTFSDADLTAEMAALRPSSNSYNTSVGEAAPRSAQSGPGPRSRSGQALRGEALQRYRNKLTKFLMDEGALLVITPGSRTDGGTVLATAAGSYDEKKPPPIPSVAVTPEQYNRIARLLEKKIPVTLEFDIQNKFHEDAKQAFNVIAELPGGDRKDEEVMLGDNLDSKTSCTGSTEHASSCAELMAVIRIH